MLKSCGELVAICLAVSFQNALSLTSVKVQPVQEREDVQEVETDTTVEMIGDTEVDGVRVLAQKDDTDTSNEAEENIENIVADILQDIITTAIKHIPDDNEQTADAKINGIQATSSTQEDDVDDYVENPENNSESEKSHEGSDATSVPRRSVRRDSVQIADFQFSSPHLLILVGVVSVTFSALGFFIAFCQLLDQKAIDPRILAADIELAQDLFFNPETHTPCLDEYQVDCGDQYGYSSFFVACALYLLYTGLQWILSNIGVSGGKKKNMKFRFSQRKASVAPEGHEPKKKSALEKYVPSLHEKILNSKKKLFPAGSKDESGRGMGTFAKVMDTRKYIKKEIKLGGSLYWVKCLIMLGVDIINQCIRCFVVQDSYATTAWKQTLAQIALMMMHVLFAMVAFYLDSASGSMGVNWVMDLLYLLVRLSLHGSLSLRSNSLLDFCSTALTFAFCVKEIRSFAKYIIYTVKHQDTSRNLNEKQKSRRLYVSGFVSLLTIIFGGILLNSVWLAANDECPVYEDASFTHQQNTDSFLPDCIIWQFDYFLEPSCSCVFLLYRYVPDSYGKHGLTTVERGECDNRGSNGYFDDPALRYPDFFGAGLLKAPSNILVNYTVGDGEISRYFHDTETSTYFDYIKNVRFLSMQGTRCALSVQDMKFIGSLQQLRVINIQAINFPPRGDDLLLAAQKHWEIFLQYDEDLEQRWDSTEIEQGTWRDRYASVREAEIVVERIREDDPGQGLAILKEWAELEHLASFSASYLALEWIHPSTVNSWKKLEQFTCAFCSGFDNKDFIKSVDLPRLKTVQFYDAMSCENITRLPRSVEDFICVEPCDTFQNCERTCDDVSEGLLEYWKDTVSGATKTGCYEPMCGIYLNSFFLYDANKDGLLDPDEFRSFYGFHAGPYFEDQRAQTTSKVSKDLFKTSVEGYPCFIEQVRDSVPFEQNIYNYSVPLDGLTILEFVAYLSDGYGNCFDCPRTQEMIEKGRDIFTDNLIPVEMPEQCQPFVWNNGFAPVSQPFAYYVDDLYSPPYRWTVGMNDQGGLVALILNIPILYEDFPPTVWQISYTDDSYLLILDGDPFFIAEAPSNAFTEGGSPPEKIMWVLIGGETEMVWTKVDEKKCEAICFASGTFIESSDFNSDGKIVDEDLNGIGSAMGLKMSFPVAAPLTPGTIDCLYAIDKTCLEHDENVGYYLTYETTQAIGMWMLGYTPSKCGECD